LFSYRGNYVGHHKPPSSAVSPTGRQIALFGNTLATVSLAWPIAQTDLFQNDCERRRLPLGAERDARTNSASSRNADGSGNARGRTRMGSPSATMKQRDTARRMRAPGRGLAAITRIRSLDERASAFTTDSSRCASFSANTYRFRLRPSDYDCRICGAISGKDCETS